jgi:hypothetical protein
VTITIAPVNDAPTVTDISDSTDEDTAVAITLTGTDVDGDALTFETSLASNGTVSIDGAVATYTPNDNFNGTDTFIYTANDGTVNSTQADVTILVIDTTLPTLTKNGSTTLQAPIVHSIIENTIFVYDFDASEPVTFALSGTDMSLFVIDNIGNLSFITAPDYETDPTTFSVDVVITDATGNETTQTITVNVTDTQLEDSDGDGVIDADDYCLNTPIGSTVDVNGCALEIEFVSSTSAVSESGTSAVVQLQVSGDETTQDVVIELTNSGTGEPTTDYNLISSSVTLDAGDYTTAQTEYFTVSIVSDQVVEGNETAIITISSVNQGFIGSNEVHTLTINDDDIAGATVNVTDNLTSEDGSTGSFTIVLTSEPTDDVTISLSSDNTAEGTISVSSVTFTPINWNITQTISVTGVDDNPPAGDGSVPYKIVTGNVTSNDTTYNALDGTTIADASMQNENNDPPGITIQILSNSNSTTEEGDTVEVGFALLTQPVTNNADVIIPLSLSDDSEGTLSATSVTVSYTEWDTPSANSITVTGLDDSILDGTIEYFLITGDPTSTDAGYDGLVESDVVDVSLNNLDDELSQTPNPIITTITQTSITGTALPESTITIYAANGTTVIGSGTADTSGNYSITYTSTQTADSTLNVTATGSELTESNQVSGIVVDTLAPTAPVVSSASGSIVTGTAEAGSTVKVTDSNGNVLGTVVADSNGNYSVTLSPTQSDGSALTVTATDTSGNESDSTSTTADALAPTAPVVSSASGSIVTGTAEAGSTVKVTDSNGNVLGTVVADSNGNYSVTLSPTQSDGSALTVTATDTSGNESDSTSTTADALAPTAPVVSSASGSIVTGTAEAGSTVKVTDSNGNVLGTAVADSNGNYSVTLSPTQSDGSALTVTATDTSGNESDSTSTTVDVSDIDSDGIPNEEDVDPDGDGTNDNGTDTDGDGINDTNDSDVDNDGIPNEEDVDPDGDGTNDNGTDTDGDGINDTNDSDNLPPTVTGDAAITINEGTTAVETYTADETVTWSKSGTDADLFTLTDAGVLSFTAAPDYEDAKDADANNTYLVTITATDSFNNVTTTNVVVTVADVDEIAPTITGEATKTVNENTTAVQTFEADETVTWSITGTDSSLFTINESTGVLVFNAAPDYEVPGDDNEDNDYVLTVTATDVAGNESTLAVTVTVADVDEIAPTITGSATKTVNEGTTAVQTFTADETVTWSITGTDASLFTINATTGVLVFNVAPDYEVPGDDNEDNDYVLTVTATDAANNQSTLAVTVTVVDLFEDEDNDGIEDHIDQCPETPEGDIVDENGCGLTQKDSDNDGVNDAIDECPETPADQKDNVDAKGCAITVGFTVTSTTVEETEGSTIITLTITGDKTSGPITVKVNFVVPTAADDATAATSGIDYKIEDNTIIIPAGDYLEGGVVEIPVSVFNDDTYESNEKVDLILDELSTGNYAQRTHVLNISDDDTVGGTIDIIDNLTSEDGETGSFSIVLNSKPTADVTIDLSSDNTEEGSININSVTFTPANWNQPKTIVVIGVDDDPAIGDGAQEYLIVTGNVTSEDPNYDELDGSTILDVPMVNENNDPPGIRARVLSATNKTSEEGATVIVGFKLLSPPVGNADVVLPVSISDDTEASIGVESVTLSAATWNDYTAHTVTITGVDDADLDGSINYLLETGDPTSEDAEYDNLTASDVANVLLVNEDDERDTDGDGILDDVDNCPETANANQADLDSDGIGDVCDTDIDGDGTDNEEDAFPRDPEEDTDTDNDGIGNNEDTDDDGDGQSDEEEEAAGSDPNDPNDKAPDTDGDGTPDFADNDDDNDGVPDDEDNCPTVKNPSQADFDGDGIGDVCDPDDDNDGQSDEDEIEAGSDPKDPDSKSEDTDGDGVPDSEDTFPNDADESVDTDGDGVGDNEDTDDDGDGTLDDEDAFPLDEDEDTDTDGDGVGNNEDADDDGDGTLDVDDAFPLDDQEDTDTDGDGIGNNEDSDDDNDRVPDAEDAFPLDGDEDTDTDDDGIGNNADTDDDGDGVLDTEDEFPLDPEEAFDADGDGLGDNEDPDDDNDGVEDIYDACPNTVPGTPVDVNGCDLLIIPTEDFTVSTTSATCSNTSDGEIVIEALDQTHSYLVTVTGQSQTIRLDQTAGYSKTLSGLAKGTYTVCFKVVGDPFFEQCYTVYIDQPEALQVVSSYLEAKQALDLQIDGATEYYVELNGVLQTRRGSRISLALQKGMNRVKIYTDLDCQGVIEEEVFVSEKLEYAPNPVVDNLNLYVGGTDTEVSLTITDLNGVVIERRTVRVPASRIYSMSMSRYREGMYLLHAKSATLDNQIKVIKR